MLFTVASELKTVISKDVMPAFYMSWQEEEEKEKVGKKKRRKKRGVKGG